MILLLASLGAAEAAPFSTSDIPYTTTFSFDWTGVVSGSTTYTFENETRITTAGACSDVAGCMAGDFSTGNGGTGSYSTDLDIEDCTVLGGPFSGFLGFTYYEVECDVIQTVDFTYDITLANYVGEAQCGTVEADAYFPFGVFGGLYNRDYSYDPETFTGTMSIPGGATGTFTE